jgi:hypothetical protein
MKISLEALQILDAIEARGSFLADDGLRRRLLGQAPRGKPRRTAGARLRRG